MDECRVNENKKLVVVTNKKTEVYDLTKSPNEKSLMVQSEKDEILHQMDLKTVISNLNNSVDLLDVSYHAVYGFTVQEKIFSLQKMLMDLNDKGILVIYDFRTQSNMVLTELIAVYKWLTRGAETVAIGKLEKFAEYASGMEAQANELAEAYQCMADHTASVLQETMKESSNQYEKTDKLRQLLADFTAEQESAAKIQESIASRLTALKADYNHLSANEEKAETRENTLAIMGAVFSFLGKAAAVVGNAKQSQEGSASEGNDSQNQEKTNAAKAEQAEIEKNLTALKAELVQLETTLKEKTEITVKSDTEKSALETEKISLREQIQVKRAKTEELAKKKTTIEKTSSGLSNLFGGAADTVSQMQSSGTASVAEERSKRLTAINNEMIRLEEENTKQLGCLTKYTKKMERTVIDQNATEAAVNALIIAISCLKRVVVAVKDIALFWSAMESCCRALSQSSLKDTIKDIQKLPKEERIEYYYTEDIMYPLMQYMAKWAAVEIISREFITAAEKTRFRLNETIVNSDSIKMSRQDHWNQASKLAGQVSGELQQQVTESGNRIKALEAKKNG